MAKRLDIPSRTWSISMVSLGHDDLKLRFPLVVGIEDYGSEFVASWPEVEIYGSGQTEADAVNALKDALVQLYKDCLGTDENDFSKTPRRWLMALRAIVCDQTVEEEHVRIWEIKQQIVKDATEVILRALQKKI